MVGYDGVVRLIDYGLALSSMKSTQTMPGVVAGTLGFVAPERAHGRADLRSDLFALGAVCWNVATTAPLASNGEDESTKMALCERLARFRRDAPAGFGEFLWTALHRDPACRFQSAKAMRDALQSSLGALASQREVASYLDSLFSREKRDAASELAEWSARYGLRQSSASPTQRSARSGATAVVPRIAEGRRDTAVVVTRPSRRRAWFLVAGVGAGLLSAGAIVFALQRQGTSHQVPESQPVGAFAAPKTDPAAPAVVAAPTRADELAAPAPAVEAPQLKATGAVPSNRNAPRVTAKTSSPSVDREISRANVLLERGQTASARQLLDELTRQPEARPRALVASAKLELHQGNYDDAIRIASQASHAGAGVEAISVRAFAELDARLYAQAVRDFRHVLELNPGDTDARDALGAAERQLRKTDR
jgi:tetratricopeptide (TPR) repeat protein